MIIIQWNSESDYRMRDFWATEYLCRKTLFNEEIEYTCVWTIGVLGD